MSGEWSENDIRQTEGVLSWARHNWSMFLVQPRSAIEQGRIWAEQIVDGARILGVAGAQVIELGDWFAVAAPQDWLVMGRVPMPPNLDIKVLPAFPEQGDNGHRPEFDLIAFAADVVTAMPGSVHYCKGSVATGDPIRACMKACDGAQRIVAFRGLDSRIDFKAT